MAKVILVDEKLTPMPYEDVFGAAERDVGGVANRFGQISTVGPLSACALKYGVTTL